MKLYIFLALFLIMVCCKNSSKQIDDKNVISNDTAITEENSILDDPQSETVYLLKKTRKVTERDVELIANYKSNWKLSKKIDKLYNYGSESYVFFTSVDLLNGNGKQLYVNFLTHDWNSEAKYDLISFKLNGKNTLISAFGFKEKGKETFDNYFVCISKSLTSEKNEYDSRYFVNMFQERCGNSACYVENVTPDNELFKQIMSNVHIYEDFKNSWIEYSKHSK